MAHAAYARAEVDFLHAAVALESVTAHPFHRIGDLDFGDGADIREGALAYFLYSLFDGEGGHVLAIPERAVGDDFYAAGDDVAYHAALVEDTSLPRFYRHRHLYALERGAASEGVFAYRNGTFVQGNVLEVRAFREGELRQVFHASGNIYTFKGCTTHEYGAVVAGHIPHLAEFGKGGGEVDVLEVLTFLERGVSDALEPFGYGDSLCAAFPECVGVDFFDR